MVAGFVLLLLTTAVNAQTTPPVTDPQTQPKVWESKNNPTVDSIAQKYSSKLVPARAALTTADIYPAIGQYESTVNTDASNVTITLDETNKGIVWINGLPQGRVKAMLRKSPSTYKIPAQKTEEGKEVAEGTLIYDKDANTLNIVIGKPFNVEDPASVFASTDDAVVTETKTKGSKTKIKTKTVKAWTYSGSKVVVETAATPNPTTGNNQ